MRLGAVHPEPVQFEALFLSRPPVLGELPVQLIPTGSRVARTAKTVAMCWGAAAVLVFIPILHFFAVPTMFVLGLILGTFAARAKVVVQAGAKFACPRCSAQVTVPDAILGWPAKVSCSECKNMIAIRPRA